MSLFACGRDRRQRIKLTFRTNGDPPEAELLQVCKIAQERSPVFDIVTNGVPVTAEVQEWRRRPGRGSRECRSQEPGIRSRNSEARIQEPGLILDSGF